MAQAHKILSCITCKIKSSCFNELNQDELSNINDNRVEVRFRQGEMICKQGSFASHIMYLNKGLAKIYIESDDKNLILNIIPEGSLIGLPSLFNENIFHYSASAIEDCIVCSIDIAAFRNMTRQNAPFSAEIINILNQNTILSYDRLISLTQKQLHGRFADGLIYLAEKVYENLEFTLSLSRKDLSELMGMSTESVIRLIKEFNNSKVINVKGKHFKIIDIEYLKTISKQG